MTAPLDVLLYATLRPDGAWDATSDVAELLAIITAAPDGVLVKTVRLRVEAPAPAAVKAEVVPQGQVRALAVAS